AGDRDHIERAIVAGLLRSRRTGGASEDRSNCGCYSIDCRNTGVLFTADRVYSTDLHRHAPSRLMPRYPYNANAPLLALIRALHHGGTTADVRERICCAHFHVYPPQRPTIVARASCCARATSCDGLRLLLEWKPYHSSVAKLTRAPSRCQRGC